MLVGMLSASSKSAPQTDVPARGHYSAPIRYDGRFTLVRLRWRADLESSRGRLGVEYAWSHDYPRAEQNLSAIVRELTYLDIHEEGNQILTLDDPDLFKYPIALMWEPGFWDLTDSEAVSLRGYLRKGGFAIFEEFNGPTQWANFEKQMHRVLPDGRLVRLDGSHQIFSAFFPMNDIDKAVRPASATRPGHYGIFEDNDPERRLLVVGNYDSREPAYRERRDERLLPFSTSHEAYELRVNSVIYGLSH
jgi:hypothetical protein